MCGYIQTPQHPIRTPNIHHITHTNVRQNMEMWKILTQKFRAQSLDEAVRPFQVQEVEDRDSGTESDEENAELQAIEAAAAVMQSQTVCDQENHRPQVMSSAGHYTATPGYHQSPVRSSSSPVTSVSKRPLQLVNAPSIPFQPLHHNTSFSPLDIYNTHLDRDSPTMSSDYDLVSSDYDQCSLDYEPGSSTEFEHHSSEDELTIINCNRQVVPEKRKWSQVNRCNSCDDSSGSSDEELRDLFSEPRPLNFSSSPPKGVQKLSHALSPTLFLANLSPKNVRLCSVSPRKRHRLMTSNDVSDATVIQRPCLDFEKMQKTLFRKHIPRGVTKARIVKIRVGLLKGTL